MIGLGSSYNYASFGAQFCLPRNVANPILSIRYKDGGAWGGWTGITASSLNGLATFTSEHWIRSSDTSSQHQ